MRNVDPFVEDLQALLSKRDAAGGGWTTEMAQEYKALLAKHGIYPKAKATKGAKHEPPG